MLNNQPAVLFLEDGTSFSGVSCGALGEAIGEINFDTSMIGYPEIISDPANAGQIIALTYPQAGNYGVALADLEASRLALRGLVLRDIPGEPSNYRSNISLPDFLVQQGTVAITGIDTRTLTRHLRANSAQRAIISTVSNDAAELLAKIQAAPSLSGSNLVAEVSCSKPYLYQMHPDHIDWYSPLAELSLKIIAVDLGIRRSTLDNLVRMGAAVIVMPWNSSAEEILEYEPHGVLFSSGPGNPRVLTPTIQTAAALLGKVPVMGIGLGHQVLALAVGGSVRRLRSGHRGANYPVFNLAQDSVAITTQNHGFCVDFRSMGELTVNQGHTAIVDNPTCGRIQLAELNLNDRTVEALRYLDVPVLSYQYLPELAPGPIIKPNPYNAFIDLISESEVNHA
ncbi:MAG: glutamine-hydrolyzing carbamoyl-phosphate synthase small subunit [Coriobacteriales bacterium]|jgi:carbamoyl-phosphate synthase small subunit|nr:glutamine-hydrolyzing carbamoyl-phosphate synthase small subunit [Coriobacteriales bacterium]